MRIRYLLLLSLGLAGCLSSDKTKTQTPITGGPMASASTVEAPELPRDQAVQATLKIGSEMEAKGFFPEAIGQYERARKLQPKTPDLAHRLAVLYDRMGNPRRAETEFDLAIKAAPKDVDLLADLGYFQCRQGRMPEAEKTLRQAIKIDPTHQQAWMNLAVALAKADKLSESRDAFCKVIGAAEADYNLAVILAGDGQTERARALLQRAVSADPALPNALTLLAKLGTGSVVQTGHQVK